MPKPIQVKAAGSSGHAPLIAPENVGMALAERLQVNPLARVVDRLMMIQTDVAGETVKYPVGHRPRRPSKRRGRGLTRTPSAAGKTSILNERWDNDVEVDVVDLIRNPTFALGQIGDLGTQWANFRYRLLTDVILENPTSYDGVSLFSASHAFGKSGTLVNALTATQVGKLNVTTATDPTPEEVTLAVSHAIGYMMGYLAEDSEPVNEGGTDWAVMFPAQLWGAFITGLKANNLASGQTNILAQITDGQVAGADGTPFSITLMPNARLTTLSEFYLFNITPTMARKPFIWQEEVPVDFAYLDESSEWAKNNDTVKAIGRWSGGCGPGEHLMAAKATFS